MRLVIALVTAGVSALAACSDSSSPSDMPQHGAMTGTVELLGNVTNPPPSGELRLYKSQEDLDQQEVHRKVALAGQGANWAFGLDSLAGGSYYLQACFNFGCGEHRSQAGELIAVPVTAGDTAVVALRL